MTTGIRNKFKGVITEIKNHGKSSDILLTSENQERILATVSNNPLDVLEIKKGSKATAFIKASLVIISDND